MPASLNMEHTAREEARVARRERIRFTSVFVACLFSCAVAAWLSGYNFDRRGHDVAAGFLASLVFSFMLGCLSGPSDNSSYEHPY